MSELGPKEVQARLRHRPPALAIERELLREDGGPRRFSTVERDAWHPAELLDAAAQAAGLCARGDQASAGLSLLVVAYERVRWPSSLSGGRFSIEVRLVRAFLSMFQFEVRAVGGGEADDEVCLQAQVTLGKEGR